MLNNFSCFWRIIFATIVKTTLCVFRSTVWENWFCMKSLHFHVFFPEIFEIFTSFRLLAKLFRKVGQNVTFRAKRRVLRKSVPSWKIQRFMIVFILRGKTTSGFWRTTFGIVLSKLFSTRHEKPFEENWEIIHTENLMYSFYWTCSGMNSHFLADVLL